MIVWEKIKDCPRQPKKSYLLATKAKPSVFCLDDKMEWSWVAASWEMRGDGTWGWFMANGQMVGWYPTHYAIISHTPEQQSDGGMTEQLLKTYEKREKVA